MIVKITFVGVKGDAAYRLEDFRMSKTMNVWLNGLVGACVGAVVNSVSNVLVHPEDLNNWQNLTKIAGVAAILGAFQWLKQHPYPVESDATPIELIKREGVLEKAREVIREEAREDVRQEVKEGRAADPIKPEVRS